MILSELLWQINSTTGSSLWTYFFILFQLHFTTRENIIFRFLPKSIFETMAFDKKNTFALGDTMKNLDFSDRVKNIKCPTLILCGKKDSANMKSADYLSQSIRSAELKIIENTGHVVNEENPKALADILNEYYLKNS